jgi:hypothetical protein
MQLYEMVMPEKYRRPREHEMRQTVERMQRAWEADADLVELGFGLDALKRDADGALIRQTEFAEVE